MKFISFCKHHLSDVISIGITLVLLIATFVGTIFLLPQTGGDTVEVYYRNKLVDTFDLNVNRKVTFCKSSTSADNCDYEVLFYACNCGKFVLDGAVKESYSLCRRPGERRQEYSSKAVAYCKTEALFERFDNDFRVRK